MREIKFRAYLKDEKKFVDIVSINFDIQMILFYDKLYEMCRGRKFKDFELMQFTGLYDRNGKEIYEGDIVKLYKPELKIEWTAIVEFGNPNGVYNWGYQLKPITNNAIIYHYNSDILCWVGMEDINVYCEVIGNIYENPELVGETK